MSIRSWSTTPSANSASPPNGWPEGMAPSGVNNSARQMMADIRETFEALGYFDYGDTPTRVDADTFTVSTDLTARYTAGKQIKLVGATTQYGTISSSSYSAPNTTIEVVGTVPTSLSTVSIGITSQPEFRITAAELAAGVTPTSYFYQPDIVIDARRHGISASNTATQNTTAFSQLNTLAPARGTILLPSGTIAVNPFVWSVPCEIRGAGPGKQGGGSYTNQFGTIIKCEDTDEFAMTVKRTQSSGFDHFKLSNIKFFGNLVGYGGVHFGSDVADGGTYSNITGIIENCWFNQFTTYGLALRRVFDTVVRNCNSTENRNATTLSTAGRGIALLANNASSSSVSLDMTVVTIEDCDTSNNHIGLYIEECEVLRILNHQASGNNREGIKFFSREYINNVWMQGGYCEVNNASRNDTGHAAPVPLAYYDVDFERDTTSTKSSTYITGVILENLHIPAGTSNVGKLYMNHVLNSRVWMRNASGDANLIAFGDDYTNIDLTLTSPIVPYSGVATTNGAQLFITFVGPNTFTLVLTGVASGSGTCLYTVVRNRVMIVPLATIEGVSNSTSFTGTGVPAVIAPTRSIEAHLSALEDNGAVCSGVGVIAGGAGTLTFYLNRVSGSNLTRSSTAWTNSGNKGWFAGSQLLYDRT